MDVDLAPRRPAASQSLLSSEHVTKFTLSFFLSSLLTSHHISYLALPSIPINLSIYSSNPPLYSKLTSSRRLPYLILSYLVQTGEQKTSPSYVVRPSLHHPPDIYAIPIPNSQHPPTSQSINKQQQSMNEASALCPSFFPPPIQSSPID